MIEDIVRLDLGFVNAYLIIGTKGPVLVDTGMPMQWEALLKGIEAAGFRHTDLKLVILTHGDPDHAGSCRRLQEECHLPIAAHRAEAEALETGVAPARRLKGLGRKVLFAFLSLQARLKGTDSPLPSFRPDILLEEGASLEAYGLDAKVFHLPGHTRGSLGMLTTSGGFIVGDLVSNRSHLGLSAFVENAEAYKASLERLRVLATGATMVYPGHGQPFDAALLKTFEWKD